MWTGPQLRTSLANFRNNLKTGGSLCENKSESENLPQECLAFRVVNRSPHLGHFQSGFSFLTADFADPADFIEVSLKNSKRFLDCARNDNPKRQNNPQSPIRTPQSAHSHSIVLGGLLEIS